MRELTDAALVWLNATADPASGVIPQWSGASAATFLHLARVAQASLPINPVVKSRIPLGLSHGDGGFKIDANRGTFSFFYSTDLSHLVYNESHDANQELKLRLRNPGPYRFQEKGRAAFEKAASEVRLPNPFKSLKVKRRRIG